MPQLASPGGLVEAKLRVLCLHGYAQTADIFRTRTGSGRKSLMSRLELVYVDAPHDAKTTGKSWFDWEELPAGNQPGSDQARPSSAVRYSGWGASRRTLDEALAAHAPVHGILGFSQGATAAAIYCAGLPEGALRFAVLVSGFLPRDPAVAASLAGPGLALPSLHLMGEADEIIPLDRSEALAQTFSGPRMAHRHPGRHLVPTCSGAVKEAWLAFLDGLPAAPETSVLNGRP
ncbi:hypothetical protein ACKKBG_A21105 [Auxenochlorella protothecoides x Auxenochlorella symbiontica]